MSTAFDVDPTSLKHVFGHTASLIHIRRALAIDYCAAAVRASEQLKFKPYEKTEGSVDFDPILKFGPALFDYHESQDFDAYFRESEWAFHVGAEAFRKAHVVNPLTVVLEGLRSSWPGPVYVAKEHETDYFAGVMRDIPSGALPHVDRAYVETPDLRVGRSIAQASLVLHLNAPSAGGALRVYDKTPTLEDDQKHTLGYGYTPDAVHGVTFRGITSGVDDAVIFPTTQIHSVDKVIGTGRRVTWSTFIGLQADGSLILWS